MTADPPHKHWSAYDEALEMACWDAIHASVADAGTVPGLESRPVARLLELSRSSGYGEADSFVTDHGVEADPSEGGHAAAHRELFEGYQDGAYWRCIDRSQNIVSRIAEARGLDTKGVSRIADAQRDAYQEGRTQRIEMESPSPGP